MIHQPLPTCVLHVTPATLSLWLDSELDSATVDRLEPHITGCAACQARLNLYQEQAWRLRHMRELEPGQRIWLNLRPQLTYPTTRRMPPMSRRVFGSVGAIVALIVIFVLLIQVVRGVAGHSASGSLTPTPPSTATPSGAIQVPNFIGKTWGDSKTLAHQLNLQPSGQHIACPTGQDNIIHDQQPPAGTSVAPGTTVTLSICAGPDYVRVPDVAGMSYAQACQVMQNAGLVCVQAAVSSTTVPAGNVVDTQPTAGSDSTKGASIQIDVSAGPTAPSPITIIDPQVTSALNVGFFSGNDVTLVRQGVALPTIHFADPVASISWSADFATLLVMTGIQAPNTTLKAYLVAIPGGTPRAIDATHLQECVVLCPIVTGRYILFPNPTSAHFQTYDVLDSQTGQVLPTVFDHIPYAPIIRGSNVYVMADAPNRCNASIVQRVTLPSGATTTVFTLPGVTSGQGIPGGSLAISGDGASLLFQPLGPISQAATNCQPASNYAPLIYATTSAINPITIDQPARISLAPDGTMGAFISQSFSGANTTTTVYQQALPTGMRYQSDLPPNSGQINAIEWTSTAILLYAATGTQSNTTTFTVYRIPIGANGQATAVATITGSQIVVPTYT